MKAKTLNRLAIFLSFSLFPLVASQADEYDDLIARAVGNSARLEANSSRDALRLPGEVVKFMGVKPGMTVLDVIAIGGYYTEILAVVVGEEGKVISHAFEAQGNDTEYAFAAQMENSDYLKNVEAIYVEFNDLEIEENTLDQIFLIQNFHDLYFERFNINPEEKLAMFRRALKPGGTLAVIDHIAADDAPSTSGNSVHRISPVLARRILEEAGFIFEEESNILRNETDDPTLMVFRPEVRGKTSRFIHRYSNP